MTDYYEITGFQCPYLTSDRIKIPLNQITIVTGDNASGKKTFFSDTIACHLEQRINALEKLCSGILIDMQKVSESPDLPPLPQVIRIPDKDNTSAKSVSNYLLPELELPHTEDCQICPECGTTGRQSSLYEILTDIKINFANKSVVCVTEIKNTKEKQKEIIIQLSKQGYLYFYADNKFLDLNETPNLPENYSWLGLFIDAFTVTDQDEQRLKEALKLAQYLTEGAICITETQDPSQINLEDCSWYHTDLICPSCGTLIGKSEKKPSSNSLSELKPEIAPEIYQLIKLFSLESLPAETSLKQLTVLIRKYIALTKLLTNPPKRPVIILLHYPTAGLSPEQSDQLLKRLKALSETQTLVIISNDPTAIDSADYMISFNKGPEKGFLSYEGKVKKIKPSCSKRNKISSEQSPFNPGQIQRINLPATSTKISEIKKSIVSQAENDFPDIIHNITTINNWSPESLLVLAQYTGLYQKIIKFMLQTKDVKIDGVKESAFKLSGRNSLACQICRAAGIVTTDSFYRRTDVCPECSGKKFQADIMKYKLKEKTLLDILEMSFLETFELFQAVPGVGRIQKAISLFDLNYLKIGIPFNLLSHSEKIRLRLVKELLNYKSSTLFIFEYPFVDFSPADTEVLIEKLRQNYCPEHSFLIFHI